MFDRDFVLGIDTSNYKTSAAIVDAQGEIICDLRKLLAVKKGERGLRQSDALFQHIENLPQMVEQALADGRNNRIGAVAFTNRPRPIEGSYMPVFKAGEGAARAVASALNVPCYSFSHQEGHIAAIKQYSQLKDLNELLCYHLSGGTSELLKVGREIEIIGGSKDISFGQVIDRVGVALGMEFPAGEEMDKLALDASVSSKGLKGIKTDGLYFNLSGIETQCQRALGANADQLVRNLFDQIADLLITVTKQAVADTGLNHILFTGGVASSQYVSRKIMKYFHGTEIKIEFGQQTLSQDNGVGIALLGGNKLWRQSR